MTRESTALWSGTLLAVTIATLAILWNPTLAAAGILGLGLVALSWARPTAGVAVWLAVLVLVPDWTPLPTFGFKPISVAGIAVVIGVMLSSRKTRTRLSWPDFGILGAALLVLLLTVLSGYPTVLIANLVGTLAVSYVLGRVAPGTAPRAYAYAMVFVALWGIFEFATGIHIFENFGVSASHHWNEIQTRAGVDRPEAGLGHAIAYGAALALALPFARELPKHTVIAQAILAAGVLVSLSRGPWLAAIFTFVLIALYGARGRARAWSLIGLALVGAVVWFGFSFLNSEEDSATTALSGEQRLVQLLATLPHVQWFGSEGIALEDGRISGLGATVIDNTFLRLAINFGWIIAAMILAPLIYAALNMLRRRATAASIALVGQIPVLAVTTLITQWQAAVFFVAGIAVTSLLASKTVNDESRPRRAAVGTLGGASCR